MKIHNLSQDTIMIQAYFSQFQQSFIFKNKIVLPETRNRSALFFVASLADKFFVGQDKVKTYFVCNLSVKRNDHLLGCRRQQWLQQQTQLALPTWQCVNFTP